MENAVHGHIAFSPDGKEICWLFLPSSDVRDSSGIHFVRQGPDGRWSSPALLESSREYGVMNLSMSPDGTKLFFNSNRLWPEDGNSRPAGNTPEAFKVWVMEKTGTVWGAPKPLEPSINQNVIGVSSALNGTLYTHGIKGSRQVGGRYVEWDQLGPPFDIGRITGGNPFISPDESYILFNRRWPGHSGHGIFVGFRLGENRWTEPVNLSERLHVSRGGSQPVVTPDGRYIFVYGQGHFEWMEAKIIQELRPRAENR
jgi:Tol biopolymer transport system component